MQVLSEQSFDLQEKYTALAQTQESVMKTSQSNFDKKSLTTFKQTPSRGTLTRHFLDGTPGARPVEFILSDVTSRIQTLIEQARLHDENNVPVDISEGKQ